MALLLFTAYPAYNPYRVLYDRSDKGLPLLQGEDVYALQKALNYFGAGLVVDGVLGPKTGAAIWSFQERPGLVRDGKAGQATQRALALGILAGFVPVDTALYRLLAGQLEHESSYLLGNYSAKREDGTFDAGVAQRNTAHTPAGAGFDPVASINALVAQVRTAYRQYADTSQFRPHTDDPKDRRYKLAAGSWNAPAFANYYAGVQPWQVPGPTAAELFLAYIEDAAVYL
jgi:peptidoglycan hydrolase-like protein with peptidoglycan-binding domain